MNQKKQKRKELNWKKILLVVMTTGLLLGGTAMFLNKKNLNEKSGEIQQYIRTTTLSAGKIIQSVSATGTVESADVSNVTTSLNTIVKSIEVQVGDVVEEGDVILILDTEELDQNIAKAEESLQSQIDKAQSAYDQAYAALTEANVTKDEAEKELSARKSEFSSALNQYQIVQNSISYYQNQYDEASSAQEKAGLILNEADTAYRKALDEAKVTTCELIVTEKEVAIEIDDISGESEETVPENQNSLTEIVMDEQAVELKTVCDAKKSAYEQAKSEYEAASQKTNLMKSELDTAKKQVNYDTYEKAYQEAESAVEKAENSLTQAEKNVSSCKESLDSAYENLEKSKTSETLDDLRTQKAECTLRAETSGTITSLNATVGSKINGTAAVIQDTENLIVSISVDESDINDVKTGMRVVITSDATDEEIEGELIQLSAVASTQTMGSSSSTFSAQVKVKDGSHGLKIGMNAKCELVISETEDVFSVPLDAIETDEDGKTYVYEKISGSGMEMEFERVEVIVGETNDFYAEIEGDNVYAGMVVRSSAVLEEAIAEGSENPFDLGSMNGMPDMSNMPNGNFNGGQMPSGGNMPAGGRGGFNGGY